MTRNVGARFPDLLDEMDKALGDLLGGADRGNCTVPFPWIYIDITFTDWVSLPCYPSVVHMISRVSARFFVGPKLSELEQVPYLQPALILFRLKSKIHGYHAKLHYACRQERIHYQAFSELAETVGSIYQKNLRAHF